MTLKQRLLDDIKTCMKSGEKERLGVVRMIQSAVKYKEVEMRTATLDPNDKRTEDQRYDEMILGVMKTMVKQRKESIDQFKAGGREDLADKEAAELKIIETYMPAQMSAPEVEAVVVQVISSLGATSKKDMGNVMKTVIAQTQGRADSKIISDIVKAKLP